MNDLSHGSYRDEFPVVIHQDGFPRSNRFACRTRLQQLIFRFQNGGYRPHFGLAIVVPEFQVAESHGELLDDFNSA